MLLSKSRHSLWLLRRTGWFVLYSFAIVSLTTCGKRDASSKVEQVEHPPLLPLDQAAMRDTVARLAKDMLVPGAVVLVRTPNGEFRQTYGVTSYRGSTPTNFD